MVLTYDVGSLPFPDRVGTHLNRLTNHSFLELARAEDASGRRRFEDTIVESFIDKVRVSISVPNYPQFMDMNDMFLSRIDGIAKTSEGYKLVGAVSVPRKKLTIPGVAVIKQRAREIYERTGAPFNVKVCVTGPYTLASLFAAKEPRLFVELGRIVSEFVTNNIFKEKVWRVALVAVDEPVFGLIDDPRLDYGHVGREELLTAWEGIFHEIKSKGVRSVIHLHETSNALFWQVKSLDIVESHVNDPLYSSSKTRALLEESDKFLKASVSVTDFDTLIRNKVSDGAAKQADINQMVANAWTDIKKGATNPIQFLESEKTISDRLRRILRQFGGRVAYAGPECGLKSFPSYSSAIECLRRVTDVAQQLHG